MKILVMQRNTSYIMLFLVVMFCALLGQESWANISIHYLAPHSSVRERELNVRFEAVAFQFLNEKLDEISAFDVALAQRRQSGLLSAQTDTEYLAINQELQGKVVFLNGHQYELQGIAIQKKQPYGYREYVEYYEGIRAISPNGKEIILRKNGSPLFFTVKEWNGTNIEGGSTTLKDTIAKTGQLRSADNSIQIYQYGGDYLVAQYKHTAPVLGFNFDRLHLSHYTPLVGLADVFNHGLQPNTVSGRAVGDNLHDYFVSYFLQKGRTAKNPYDGNREYSVYDSKDVYLLVDIGSELQPKALFIPSDKVPNEILGDVQRSGIRIDPPLGERNIDSGKWNTGEVQGGALAPGAIKGLAIKKIFLEQVMELMREGYIPSIPVYDGANGDLLNREFLEEKNRNHIYGIEDVSVSSSVSEIQVDVTVFAGDWGLGNVIDQMGLDWIMRYGLSTPGGMMWSNQDGMPDLRVRRIEPLGRTESQGYRVRLTFPRPKNYTGKIEFSLRMISRFGQVLWQNNNNKNFQIELSIPIDIDRSDETVSGRAA